MDHIIGIYKNTCMKKEIDISIVDIQKIIKSLKNDKAPGCDGFPVEFYKANIIWICEDLLHIYWEAFNNWSLGSIINCGVIKLLLNEGDKGLIKNWRPITLLNVSDKIFAKILAQRLQSILPKFVTPSQTSFIKGRYILENSIIGQEVMRWAKDSAQDYAMLLFDFEKSYDRIEWDFILMMLEAFSFQGAYL